MSFENLKEQAGIVEGLVSDLDGVFIDDLPHIINKVQIETERLIAEIDKLEEE